MTPGDEARARVQAAARALREMLPALTSYARALTGRQRVSVALGSMTKTDGTTIWIRPPLELAERGQHELALCSERGDDGLLLCTRCRTTEAVYWQLYHEIAHIVSESSRLFDVRELRPVALGAAHRVSGTYATFVGTRIVGGPDAAHTYGIAARVHTIAIALMRAFDDWRIDTLAGIARPGVARIYRAAYLSILTNGIDDGHEENWHWRDQPTAIQLPIALMMAKHGFDIPAYFSDQVSEIIAHPRVAGVLEMPLETQFQVLDMTINMLGVLAELGVYDIGIEEESRDEQNQGEAPDAGIPVPAPDENSLGELGGSPGGPDGDTAPPGDPAGAGEAGSGGGDDHPDTEMGEPSSGERPVDNPAADEPDRADADDLGDRGEQAPQGDAEPDHQPGDAGPEERDSGLDEPDPEEAGDLGAGAPDLEFDLGEQVPIGDLGGDGDDPPVRERFSVTPVDPDEVARVVAEATGHGDDKPDEVPAELIEKVLRQLDDFDSISVTVTGVTIFDPFVGRPYLGAQNAVARGEHHHDPVSAAAITPAILHARRIFSDSSLNRYNGNLRSGKVDPRVLARRIPNGDDRIFRKIQRGDSVDDELIFGIDLSSSTEVGDKPNILIRSLCEAMANTVQAVGVKFEIWGHTTHGREVAMHTIKLLQEPWGNEQRWRLRLAHGAGGSYDGHNIEFYRKRISKSVARRRTIIYFTDGNIPETNKGEETEIIHRETALLAQARIGLMAIGVRTDSPRNFGLDTILIEGQDDIATAVRELEARLTKF